MKNIVLIGLPGSGKTTLGKLLSKKLNRPFVDMDVVLEQKDNMSISEMCRVHGKEFFRDRESEISAEVGNLQGAVIATGGGTVLREQNMSALSQNGVIIFLGRPPEHIIKSGIETGTRPFLQNPKDLYTLYDERVNLYRAYSSHTVKNIKLEDCLASLVAIANDEIMVE